MDNQEVADPNQLAVAHDVDGDHGDIDGFPNGGGGGGHGGEGNVGVGGDVARVQQIFNFLRYASVALGWAEEWVTTGLHMIEDAPVAGLRFTRVKSGIRECRYYISVARLNILLAVHELHGIIHHAAVIGPFPGVIASVREAHDVINAEILSLHGFLLPILRRQILGDAVVQLQMGLANYHIAMGHCNSAFSLIESDDEDEDVDADDED